jgi:SAM-dependent methyltransferase
MRGGTAPPLEFTAHNIELSDGTRTMPDEPLLRDWGICRAALRTLRLLVPITDPATPPRVVDLGCCEGGYAVEFARAGYDVVGIEGRRSNVDKCEYVAERVDLPNLRFIHDDARNIRSHGTFDASFCCGLLYHLDNPAAYLRDLADVTRRVLLLQTHYATRHDEEWTTFHLSPLTVHEGRLGRWYKEWEPDATPEEIETFAWSSVGNSSSFWLEKEHLLQAIMDAGFPIVCEQYDFLEDIVESDYTEDQHRSFFLGLKEAAASAAGRAAQVEETPGELDDLQDELASVRSTLEARANQLGEREAEIDTLENELASARPTLEARANQLGEREAEIDTLENELRWIKSTKLWRAGSRWWRLKAVFRRNRSR